MSYSSNLLDALAIAHGPQTRLHRYFVNADRVAAGLDLTVKVHSLDALFPVYDRHEDSFHGLPPFFDTRLVPDTPGPAYCFIAYDGTGAPVATFAVLNLDLRGLSLATELSTLRLFGGHGDHVQTPPIAAEIHGHAMYCGGYWVRPDWRGRGLGDLLPPIGSYYGLAHWPVTYRIAFGSTAWQDPNFARLYQFEATQKGFRLSKNNAVIYEGLLSWGRAEYALDELDERTRRLARRNLERVAGPAVTVAPA